MPLTDLPFVQRQMIRYGMTTYFMLGLVGNLLNCLLFARPSKRRTASSVYLLALSIFAIVYLLWAVIPYVYTLYYPDPQTYSIGYCKIRLYFGHVLGQYVRFTLVFACADRYFATRTAVRVRSLNSVRKATALVILLCPTCLLIAIHAPILMEIRNGVCGMFGVYKLIYAIYQITLVGLLPPVLMCIFSMLTIYNLHQQHCAQRHGVRRDRYLMRMLIAEVLVNIVTSIPYSANLIYGAATYGTGDKSPARLEIESFVSFVTVFVIYLISVVPFYLFVATSKPFRQELRKMLDRYVYRFVLRRAQIRPTIDQTLTVTRHGQMNDGRK